MDTFVVSYFISNLKHIIVEHCALQFWDPQGKAIYEPCMDAHISHRSSSNISTWCCIWLSKWHFGICGVGKWLQRWNDQLHSKCPRCLTCNEMVQHFIHYPHPDVAFSGPQA